MSPEENAQVVFLRYSFAQGTHLDRISDVVRTCRAHHRYEDGTTPPDDGMAMEDLRAAFRVRDRAIPATVAEALRQRGGISFKMANLSENETQVAVVFEPS